MRTNNTNTGKKIPQFDYAALAGNQSPVPDAPCACGDADHQAAATTAPDNQPQASAGGRKNPPTEPFCWYHGGAQTPEQEVIEQAHDIATGIMEILAMIEGDDVAVDCDEDRMLSPSRRANLMRLAITSARMLSEECGCNIDYTNDKRRAK